MNGLENGRWLLPCGSRVFETYLSGHLFGQHRLNKEFWTGFDWSVFFYCHSPIIKRAPFVFLLSISERDGLSPV